MLKNLFSSYGWAIGELVILALAIAELVALKRSMRRSRERRAASQSIDGHGKEA